MDGEPGEDGCVWELCELGLPATGGLPPMFSLKEFYTVAGNIHDMRPVALHEFGPQAARMRCAWGWELAAVVFWKATPAAW